MVRHADDFPCTEKMLLCICQDLAILQQRLRIETAHTHADVVRALIPEEYEAATCRTETPRVFFACVVLAQSSL